LPFNYFKRFEFANAQAIATSGAVIRILHNDVNSFFVFYHFKNVSATSFKTLSASGTVLPRNADGFAQPAYMTVNAAGQPKRDERADNVISHIHIILISTVNDKRAEKIFYEPSAGCASLTCGYENNALRAFTPTRTASPRRQESIFAILSTRFGERTTRRVGFS
jgi:hypothetical protein